MILWNIVTIILAILVLIEAYRNDWGLPKFEGWATVGLLWLGGTIALSAIQSTGI